MYTKDSLVVDVLDAEPEAGWEGADQDVEVEEEWDPGCGLVLRHRGDDWDVDLSVAEQHEHRAVEWGEKKRWEREREIEMSKPQKM